VVGVGDTAGLIQYVNSQAPSYGLDPAAVLAVAKQEGWSGAIGDSGHAYGPWQDWLGLDGRPFAGTPPNTQAANTWAWSPDGINYVLGQMASSGAKGQSGLQAIQSITKNFERPAEPPKGIGWWQEAQNAFANAYESFKNGSAVGTSGSVSTVDPSLASGAALVSGASSGSESPAASSAGGGQFTLVPAVSGPLGFDWPGIKISTGFLWSVGFFILAGLLIIAGLVFAFRQQIEATAASAAKGLATAA
jgi:hypothetical protein